MRKVKEELQNKYGAEAKRVGTEVKWSNQSLKRTKSVLWKIMWLKFFGKVLLICSEVKNRMTSPEVRSLTTKATALD